MISLRTSYLLLVLTCALLPLAFASQDALAVMWAVACVVFAGQIVGQTRAAVRESAPSQSRRTASRRSAGRDRDR